MVITYKGKEYWIYECTAWQNESKREIERNLKKLFKSGALSPPLTLATKIKVVCKEVKRK